MRQEPGLRPEQVLEGSDARDTLGQDRDRIESNLAAGRASEYVSTNHGATLDVTEDRARSKTRQSEVQPAGSSRRRHVSWVGAEERRVKR